MRYLKKLCIFVFALFVCFSLVKVNAIGPKLAVNFNLEVLGASVRTTGNAGIRFEANIGGFDDSDVKKYGILIAYGLTSTNDDFCKGGTVNGKAVLSVEVDKVDAEGKYYATIYNVPSNQYVQDITARAYVVLNNGDIVYGQIPTNRCLAEVVVKAHDAEVEGDIITTVYDTIERISIDKETSYSFYFNWEYQYGIYYYEKFPNYIVKAGLDLDNGKDNILVEYKDENPVNNVMAFFKKGKTAFDTISGVLGVAGVEKVNADRDDVREGVFVFNGEYDEDIELNKCSLWFETANVNLNMSHSDVYVEDAKSQVIIDGKVTITGNYINIYGFVFKNQIEIAGVDEVLIGNSITNYTDTAVLVSSESFNLVFQSFYQAGSGARCIYVQAPVTNFGVNGFVVLDQAVVDKDKNANYDNIRFGIDSEQYAKGNIIIEGCYFRAIQMGICDRNPSAELYEITKNYFKQCKTAIQLRNGTNSNEMEYVIKANTFDDCGRITGDWYALEMYTNANTTAKVNYNLFLDSEFNSTTPIIKVKEVAGATYNFTNNYFWNSVNEDTNDFDATNFCQPAKETLNLTLWELQQYGSTYETDKDIYTVVYEGVGYYIYGLSIFGPENVVE